MRSIHYDKTEVVCVWQMLWIVYGIMRSVQYDKTEVVRV